jgi:ribonuclease E
MTAAQGAADQSTPQEHLQKADAALNGISTDAIAGSAKTQIAELKKHVNALQKMTASGASSAASSQWSAETAAADRILSGLLASTPSTGTPSASTAGEPNAVGTSGTTSPRATAAVSLDQETRASLQQVRENLTAFAASMGRSASPSSTATPDATAPSSVPDSAASAPGASSPIANAPDESPAQPNPQQTAPSEAASSPQAAAPSSNRPSEESSSAAPSSSAQAATPAEQPQAESATQPPASAEAPAQQPADNAAAQPPSATAPATASAAPGQVDTDTAKQALTAARDTLSQLTQLPAAQQLTGEARTQVSQLISNFNDLITTNTDWKAAYSKVDADLTALIGAQTADESTAATAGTAGAVGTSGTTASSLDPAIKAKLVEFRTHLNAFEQAAGGADKK